MRKVAERQVCMKVTHSGDPVRNKNKSLPGAVVHKSMLIITVSQKETVYKSCSHRNNSL